MAKKIRLIDEEGTTTTTTDTNTTEVSVPGLDGAQMMKYAEAIDWKLWEILKLLRAQVGAVSLLLVAVVRRVVIHRSARLLADAQGLPGLCHLLPCNVVDYLAKALDEAEKGRGCNWRGRGVYVVRPCGAFTHQR